MTDAAQQTLSIAGILTGILVAGTAILVHQPLMAMMGGMQIGMLSMRLIYAPWKKRVL